MSGQTNWYIEYDNKTFSILHSSKYEKYIFKAAQLFENVPACQPTENTDISNWVTVLSNSVKDICQLLYNFFYVQQKLASQEIVKVAFFQIYRVLKVQNLYSSFFYMASQNFRINRIFACIIRLNRFLKALFDHIENIKKNLDDTFLQNLDQVYIFIQQKLKETLATTEKLGNNDINIILLDTLSLMLRNFGDSSMHKILDKTKVTKIMLAIEKENEVYQQFELNKKKEQEDFKEKQYFAFPMPGEEDPKMKEKIVEQIIEED